MTISPADQVKAAAIAAKCSGSLSIIGSSLILYNIYTKMKSSRMNRPVLLRILMGMSIFDVFSSSMYVIGSWAIPPDKADENAFAPRGSDAFCVAQAAIFQAFEPVLYNLSLATYYYVTVNRNWKDEKLRKYEWRFHVAPMLFGTSTAIYGIAANQFNPNEYWCWFGGTAKSDALKFGLYYGPLWTAFAIVVTLFALIYRRVREQEKASLQYRFEHSVVEHSIAALDESQMGDDGSAAAWDNDADDECRSTTSSVASFQLSNILGLKMDKVPKDRRREFARQRSEMAIVSSKLSRPVFWQGALFASAFIITFLFPTITRTKQLLGHSVEFPLMFAMALTLPLQGFLNCLVYFKKEIWDYLTTANGCRRWLQPKATPPVAPTSQGIMRRRQENLSTGVDKLSGRASSVVKKEVSWFSSAPISQESSIRKETTFSCLGGSEAELSVVVEEDAKLTSSIRSSASLASKEFFLSNLQIPEDQYDSQPSTEQSSIPTEDGDGDGDSKSFNMTDSTSPPVSQDIKPQEQAQDLDEDCESATIEATEKQDC